MGWFKDLIPTVLGAALAPFTGGASLAAGAALTGAKMDSKANRKLADQQAALQREFAQHGVRWRVEDAKAAGIHPLAALGMQGMPYSPVSFSSGIGSAFAEMGQAVGSRVLTPNERIMQRLALSTAMKGLEESDARIAVLRSEEFRNYQESNAVKTFPVEGPPTAFWQDLGTHPEVGSKVVPESVVPKGMITAKAPDVISHTAGDVSTMAGNTPLWRNFTVAPGIRLALPGGVSGDAAEVLESLAESPVLLAAVIAHNRKVNPESARWLDELFTSKKGWSWRSPGEWVAEKLWNLKVRGAQSRRDRGMPYDPWLADWNRR